MSERSLMTKGLAVAGAGALLYGVYEYANDRLDFLPDWSLPGWIEGFGDSQSHPPEVDASVLQDTYGVDARFDLDCSATASVGVGVHGNKDEMMGGGEMDKIWFVDFDLCGEIGSVVVNADVRMDANTQQAVAVVATTNGLQIHRPRFNATDYRNCVDLRHDDDAEEIADKIEAWEESDSGDRECDDGFEVSGLWGGSDMANVITTSQAGAQLAAMLDADARNEVFDELQEDFLEELRTELENKYPEVDPDQIQLDLTGQSDHIQAQIDAAVEEIQSEYMDLEWEDEEEGRLKVSRPGGGEVTVDISAQERGEVTIEALGGAGVN